MKMVKATEMTSDNLADYLSKRNQTQQQTSIDKLTSSSSSSLAAGALVDVKTRQKEKILGRATADVQLLKLFRSFMPEEVCGFVSSYSQIGNDVGTTSTTNKVDLLEEGKVIMYTFDSMQTAEEQKKITMTTEQLTAYNVSPAVRNKYNSILLQLLSVLAMLLPSDYELKLVKETIAELEKYEDDNDLINSFAKGEREGVNKFIKLYALKYLETKDLQIKEAIVKRLSTWTQFNKVFFNGMRCDVCTETKAFKCIGCGVSAYCSPKCMEKDYNERGHKEICTLKRTMFENFITTNTLKYGLPLANRLANHIWTISSDILSAFEIKSLVFDNYIVRRISEKEEARASHEDYSDITNNNNNNSNGTGASVISSKKQEIARLTILYEWLETHQAPCNLTVNAKDRNSPCAWILTRQGKTCVRCKSRKAQFCRLCTMIDSCEYCYTSIHSPSRCSIVKEDLKLLMRKVIYRRNLFGETLPIV